MSTPRLPNVAGRSRGSVLHEEVFADAAFYAPPDGRMPPPKTRPGGSGGASGWADLSCRAQRRAPEDVGARSPMCSNSAASSPAGRRPRP